VTDCVRRAWLVLGERVLPLEDDGAGYACTELDLGYPEVRDVVNNRPGQDGTDDRTVYMGSRAMSADIYASGGSMTVDEIGAAFAPYMLPNARPELHYVLDRPGAPERVATVRAAAYTWPVSGKKTRAIHLGWVAPDPILRDPTEQVAVAMAGSTSANGRVYNFVPNRLYPPGAGAASTGEIRSAGDVVVRPLVRVYGPVTNPVVTLTPTTGADPSGPPAVLRFARGFVIDAGAWVDVDTAAKTAYRNSDPAQSVMASMDWANTVWPVLPTLPYFSWLTMAGDSTSSTTQAQARWHDGYLN
jgi:hypothetical protein